MMLSNQDIMQAMDSGELVVDPMCEHTIKSAGLLLHLGHKLLKPVPDTVVDVKNNIVPRYEELLIEDDKPYALKPSEFLLGHTFERISVGQSLGFLIEGRSTLARIGLTVVQTAMLVYPGHKNRGVTLELANHGVNTILLYPKMKIARVALFELKNPSSISYDDAGKYRNQGEVGKPIFVNEFRK